MIALMSPDAFGTDCKKLKCQANVNCEFMSHGTPPVTPRENTRCNKSALILSPGDGAFTPAKVDDISRASSIRIPATKHRSPVLSFRQPVITERSLTTPPYPKRRKSSGSSGDDAALSTPRQTSVAEAGSGFITPPARLQEALAAPGAPRKGAKPRSPTLAPEEEDLVPLVRRRLDFGQTGAADVMPCEQVDWDSFLLPGSRRRSDFDLRRAVRLISAAGLEARGECALYELKRVLSAGLGSKGSDRAIEKLRAHSDWIEIQGASVVFPGRVSAATVVDTLN